jgi:hypothetical protein
MALLLCTGLMACQSSGKDGSLDSKVSEQNRAAIVQWEQQMLEFGHQHCTTLTRKSGVFDVLLNAVYYDAQRVYFEMRDYTGDDTWSTCARAAEDVYLSYVDQNGGRIPAYRVYTEGLLRSYLQTPRAGLRSSILSICSNAAFASDETPLANTAGPQYLRERSLILMAYLTEYALSERQRSKLRGFIQQTLDDFQAWSENSETVGMRPFFTALAAESLIRYTEAFPDPRIVPALSTVANKLWSDGWDTVAGGFRYALDDSDSATAAPDLNLLIAPLYGWLYQQTGDAAFARKGDEIFQNGVQKAYLKGPKQFNQNYHWSFDYVRWRFGITSSSKQGTEGKVP